MIWQVVTCAVWSLVGFLADRLLLAGLFRRAEINHERLVSGLLAVVAPRCSSCCRAATRFKGTNYSTESPTAPKRYACDVHGSPPVAFGMTDLPGAEAVRAAEALLEQGEKR